MEPILRITTLVTQSRIPEFKILNYSVAQHNPNVQWIVATSEDCYDQIKAMPNIDSILTGVEEGMEGVHQGPEFNEEQKDRFYKTIMSKLDIIEHSIKFHGYGMFLDVDMFFVNPLPKLLVHSIVSAQFDAYTSNHWLPPAWTNSVGLFNVGALAITNLKIMDKWRELTLSRQYYYEQKPFELAVAGWNTFEMPYGVNVGGWKIKNPIVTSNNQIFVNDQNGIITPVQSFHMHILPRFRTFSDPQNHIFPQTLKALRDGSEKHKALYNMIELIA